MMFNSLIIDEPRPDIDIMPVVDGKVACPRLRLVSLERCLECPYLLGMDGGQRPRVRCITQPSSDVEWDSADG